MLLPSEPVPWPRGFLVRTNGSWFGLVTTSPGWRVVHYRCGTAPDSHRTSVSRPCRQC